MQYQVLIGEGNYISKLKLTAMSLKLKKSTLGDNMNETRKRSLTKSISWRIICIVVSILIAYILTNELDLAATIGTVYNAITMILYYFHERIWNKIKWGAKLD